MDVDGRTPEVWYKSLPPLTRFALTVTFIVTLVSTLGLFNPAHLILDWRLVTRKFQFWRLTTDYFYAGPFSIGWLFHIYFLVTFSARLEVNEMFTATPGAYLFFLLFQVCTLDILSLIVYWPTGKPILAPSLVMAIIYYWSRREAFSPIGLWGFTLQAYQFPFALLFLDLIMGHSMWIGIMGLLSGHLFYFLADVLPQEGKFDLLKKPPKICDEIMRRCARFDIHQPMTSIKMLILGAEPVYVSPEAFPRASDGFSSSRFSTLNQLRRTNTASTNTASTNTASRLFTGEGRRLGES